MGSACRCVSVTEETGGGQREGSLAECREKDRVEEEGQTVCERNKWKGGER